MVFIPLKIKFLAFGYNHLYFFKESKMKSIVVNIQDDNLVDKVLWLLDHFKNDGVEVVLKEDMEDLKLLKETRNDEKINFEDYLKNAN